MPDYQSPFGAAADALRPKPGSLPPPGRQPSLAPSPVNVAGPRSIFDDPGIKAMLANFGSLPPGSPPQASPAWTAPVNDSAAPAYDPYATPGSIGAQRATIQAMTLPDQSSGSNGDLIPPRENQVSPIAPNSPSAATPQDLLKQITANANNPPPMAMLGGAAPQPQSSQGGQAGQQWQQMLTSLMNQQPQQVQANYIPHLMLDAVSKDPADRARFAAQQDAISKADQFNATSALSSRGQSMAALNELMKSQSDQQTQQQHLDLEARKQKFMESEAARLKGDEPRRQGLEDKLTADTLAKNPGMSAEEAAKRARMAAEKVFPRTTTTTQPPGGTNPPPGGQNLTGGQKTITNYGDILPSGIFNLTAAKNDAGTAPKTSPESFMTQVYRMDKAGELPKGTKMSDIIGFMKDQYGAKAVEDALKPGHLGGIDSEMFNSGMTNFMNTIGMGNKTESDLPYQAQSAFRNALGRGDQNKTPGMSALEYPGAKLTQGLGWLIDQLRK